MQLQQVAASIIWKNEAEAKHYEFMCDPREVDYFMAANRGMIAFDNVFYIPRHILTQLGLNDELVDLYSANKDAIPDALIPLVMKLYWNDIVDSYVEKNTYYRMLNGQPPINTDPKDYVYNTEYVDIAMDVPVHELPLPDRYTLEARGYIEKMLNLYPEKKYLKYMAKYQVDVFKARSAESFAILSIKTSEPEHLTEDFKTVYKSCRDYMVRVHYTSAYKSMDKLDYYENFIGLSILFMAITQMNYKYLEADISRDFYDLESLKVVYDSYGVPFYEKVPLKYHKRIVKWINRIINNKGNTKVFFDLSALFDYSSLQIYYYYLTKDHKVDHNGNPVFEYKEDGSLDYEKMYDLSFSKVPVGEDPYIHIIDKSTHEDYYKITDEDEFWVNDQELLDELYKDEFNFIESKYIGISLQFDIMSIMFEECYFLRLIQDRKWDTEELYIYYGDMKASIFDLVIYLIASICKKWGFPGTIPNRPEQIGRVYGFNFKDNLNIIRDEVLNNPYLDDKINDYIVDMNIHELGDVHKLFKNITDLRKFLEKKLMEVHDRETYQAYREIYKVLMTTELIPQVFATDEDEETGEYTMAKSFNELLQSRNSYLYNKIIDLDVDVDKEIDNVLLTLKSLSDKLEYLEMADGIDIEILVTHLYNLLEFARSAKTELLEFEIIYLLNSRATNLIKIFMELKDLHAQVLVEDVGMRFDDVLQRGDISLYSEEYIKMRELLMHISNLIYVSDDVKIEDHMQDLYAIVQAFEIFAFDDVIENTLYEMDLGDRMNLIDRFINNSTRTDIQDIMNLTHQVLAYNQYRRYDEQVRLEDVLMPMVLEVVWRTDLVLKEELIPTRIAARYHEGLELLERLVNQVESKTYELIDVVDYTNKDMVLAVNDVHQFADSATHRMAKCFTLYIKPYFKVTHERDLYYTEYLPVKETLKEADFGSLGSDQV